MVLHTTVRALNSECNVLHAKVAVLKVRELALNA